MGTVPQVERITDPVAASQIDWGSRWTPCVLTSEALGALEAVELFRKEESAGHTALFDVSKDFCAAAIGATRALSPISNLEVAAQVEKLFVFLRAKGVKLHGHIDAATKHTLRDALLPTFYAMTPAFFPFCSPRNIISLASSGGGKGPGQWR